METLNKQLETDLRNKKLIKNYEFKKDYKYFKIYQKIKNKKHYHIKYYDMKLRNNDIFKYNKLSICNYKTNVIKYFTE